MIVFNVPCRFVGHTMADSIPLKPDRHEACNVLNIDEKQRYMAILVGSRSAEVELLSEPFFTNCTTPKRKIPRFEVFSAID